MNGSSAHRIKQAVVLAGGASSRFGGPKMTARLGDQTMIEHVVSTVASYLEPVIISVRDHKQVPRSLWEMCLIDERPGLGPVGGLRTSLHSDGWTLVVAGDLPSVGARHLDDLCSRVRPELDAVIAVDAEGRTQPLLACYHGSARASLEATISSGNLSMGGFVERLDSVKYVTLPDDALRNVNRREDLPSGR